MLCGPWYGVERACALAMRLALFLPKYWATWVGLCVLRTIELLPFPVQRHIGSALGKLIQRLPLAYVRIARRNVELCMPTLSARDRADMVDRHCQSLGVGLCETANTWWSSDRRVHKLAEIHGLENLHAALAKGRGAIMIGGHFTTIEIATRILGTVVPLNVVYRPMKNAVLSHTMFTSFSRHGKPIAHDDIRTMIRALKKNEAVWYAPDQSYRNKGAAMANFFGIPAATTTATSRLARFPGPDPIGDVERFHALLEAHIRRVPEQYLWVHRRFKGLTTDYPDYYGHDSRNRAPVQHP